MEPKAPLSVRETIEQVASSTRRSRYKRWLAGMLAVLLAAAIVIVVRPPGRAGIPEYQTRPVQRGDLSITVTATGNLEATNQVEVGSELSGIIKSMTADYNDTVKAGQPLAYLDDAKTRAAVMKSRASVDAAEADCQEAVATRKANRRKLERYRRTRELTGGKLPSMEALEDAEADLERAVAAVAAAEAAISSARAALQSDEADLKKTVIYAPISGIVLSRDVQPGQTVAASLEAPVLYTLAEDLRRMELQVDVDEADVGQVREGQAAVFTVDAYPDRSFAATITQVRFGSETTDNVVTYKTVLKVDNPDLLLRPGMTATATITVRKIENALLVPNTALRFTPDPPKENATMPDRSLLRRLLPGPPPGRRGRKTLPGVPVDSGPDGARVWILENGHPVPVPVETIATDGMITAVHASALAEGTAVVLNTITPADG